MIADKILHKLEGVKQTGQDRWIARCPSHEDHTPSLAIREVDDRVLIYCFAGCLTQEVVNAVGLEMADLFPEKLEGHKPLSRPIPAMDILKCLQSEIMFLMVCASSLARGEKLLSEDHERLLISAGRFRAALTAGGVT